MLLFIICEAPKKISTIFRPFLAIFTLFHLKNWPYLQKPQLGNLGETRFWLLLVNNSLCSIPLSWTRSYIKETPGDRCALPPSYIWGRNHRAAQQWSISWCHNTTINYKHKHRAELECGHRECHREAWFIACMWLHPSPALPQWRVARLQNIDQITSRQSAATSHSQPQPSFRVNRNCFQLSS